MFWVNISHQISNIMNQASLEFKRTEEIVTSIFCNNISQCLDTLTCPVNSVSGLPIRCIMKNLEIRHTIIKSTLKYILTD